MGSWVRGQPGAGLGIWDPPPPRTLTVNTNPLCEAAQRAHVTQHPPPTTPPTLPPASFMHRPLQNGQLGPALLPCGFWDQVADNYPLLLAAPGPGWALGSWPDCRGAGLVLDPSQCSAPRGPQINSHNLLLLDTHSDLDLTHSQPQSWVGDLDLVPGTEAGSGARWCQGRGCTDGEHSKV